MSVLVSETSGIKKYQDIKGKRYIGLYTGSAGQTAQAQAALANYGFTEKDVKMVSVPGVGPAIRALIEGRADASGTGALGMGLVAELDAGKGARFISYDTSPEAIKRFQALYPAEPVRVEPGPGKVGIKEPTTMMAYDTYLVSRANLSDDAAYEIVKVLWEYNKELWPIHVGLKSWTTDKFVIEKPLVPYHPGVIKFYKEKGVWNAKVDEIQQSLLGMEK
jgi:TRAP transporter TAXI family solute receptor